MYNSTSTCPARPCGSMHWICVSTTCFGPCAATITSTTQGRQVKPYWHTHCTDRRQRAYRQQDGHGDGLPAGGVVAHHVQVGVEGEHHSGLGRAGGRWRKGKEWSSDDGCMVRADYPLLVVLTCRMGCVLAFCSVILSRNFGPSLHRGETDSSTGDQPPSIGRQEKDNLPLHLHLDADIVRANGRRAL